MARSLTSFSELSTLAECERKWAFRYRDHAESAPTRPMVKGSLIHGALGPWWQGEDWEEAFWETFQGLDAAADPDTVDDALWLLRRYVEWYGPERHLWKVVASELELRAKLPRVGNVVLGYVDQIMEEVETGDLWLVERKTMSDWQRLNYLSVDPQLTLYAWLVRENGWDVKGIAFDAIRTYRWSLSKPTQKQLIEDAESLAAKGGQAPWVSRGISKRDWAKAQVEAHPGVERELADSFQWLAQDRTGAHIEAALDEAVGAVRRRQAIRRGARPLRNLGRACRGCFFEADCHAELAFAPPTIIVEDDE